VERIKLARRLAGDTGAEVTGEPCVLTALMRYPFMKGDATAVTLMEDVDRESIEKMRTTFPARACGHGWLHWAEPLSEGWRGLARQALYADLTAAELPPDFQSCVLLASGRPALILPFAGATAWAVPKTTMWATICCLGQQMVADLLVMSCYGHGRPRDWVLGGATRAVPGPMTLPVLIAH